MEDELQSIADKQHLHALIDEMGPRDYAVLLCFRHTNEVGHEGWVKVSRMCFRHVAYGMMDEAREILRRE
jgi:hypothetical protein